MKNFFICVKKGYSYMLLFSRILLLILTISVFSSAYGRYPYSVLSDQTVTENQTTSSYCADNLVSIFPKEIYLGDAFYIANIYKNSQNVPTSVDCRKLVGSMPTSDVIVILAYKDRSYLYLFEEASHPRNSGSLSSSLLKTSQLQPGEVAIKKVVVAETPPLEDWDHDFWRKVRLDVDQNSEVELTVYLRLKVLGLQHKWLQESIKIKSRPESEVALLEKWHNEVVPTSLPVVQRYVETDHSSGLRHYITDKYLVPEIGLSEFAYSKYSLPSTEEANATSVPVSEGAHIKKNGLLGCVRARSYDPSELKIPLSSVVRLGFRKPTFPNVPSTLSGWFNLETSFSPGATRDEIHLTALMLDYVAARQVESQDLNQKSKTLLEWVSNLPYAQRCAFIAIIYNKAPELQNELAKLIKDDADAASYCFNSRDLANPLMSTYDQIIETTRLLDPLVESDNAGFQYGEVIKRYKEIGDQRYRAELELMKKREGSHKR